MAALGSLAGCAAKTAVAPPPAMAASTATAPAVDGCEAARPGDPVVSFGSTSLVTLCRDVFVDPAAKPGERAQLVHLVAVAWSRVGSAFGTTVSPRPIVVFCAAACVAALGISGRAHATRPGQPLPGARFVPEDRAMIMTGSQGGVPYLVHEMTHVETNVRLGAASAPQWFTEGLAFSLAGQRGSFGCSHLHGAVDDLRKLSHNWLAFNDRHGQKATKAAYCQAGAELDAWLARAGTHGMTDLLARVRSGAPFATAYGPLLTAETVRATNADDVEADDETRVNNGQVEIVTLSGESDSFAQTALMGRLSDPAAPFTIALWIKPARNGGTLVHLSASPQGNGWCTPLLGYGEDGRLVAEVLEDARSRTPYVAVTAPEPLAAGRWTHVAMTWAPNASTRLYIDGAEAARASAGTYQAIGAGLPLFVTWGGPNLLGDSCLAGAIRPGPFAGSIRAMKTFGTELTAAEIAALVKDTAPPPP